MTAGQRAVHRSQNCLVGRASRYNGRRIGYWCFVEAPHIRTFYRIVASYMSPVTVPTSRFLLITLLTGSVRQENSIQELYDAPLPSGFYSYRIRAVTSDGFSSWKLYRYSLMVDHACKHIAPQVKPIEKYHFISIA
jgi:hypothetical protein